VAYFGQKDYQQAVVVQRMVRDLDIPVVIRVLPTVRESDGLALSSRNAYLSRRERQAATCLYKGLSAAKRLAGQGERRAGALRDRCRETIAREPLAAVEYVEIADARSLRPLAAETPIDMPAVLAVAARIGSCRLIDNVLFE
jgi:pantoate--beta-alanine ligase